MPRLAAFLVWFLLPILSCLGQTPAVYNINKYNGLQSNHVYGTLVDKHGYLWLATVDGVYRYNGYSLKRYGYNEGLSNAEVWNFYEDERGRIWLMSIAEDLGYIHHGKYTSVHRQSDRSHVLYPTNVTELGDSLIFSNRSAPPGVFELCIVANDTLYSVIRPENPRVVYFFILQGKIVEGDDSAISIFQTKDWINSRPPARTIPLSGLKDALMRSTQRGSFFDKYIYGAALEDNKIFFFNIDAISTDTIHLQQGLYHCFPGKKEFYVLTKSRLLIYDTLLRQTSAIDLSQISSPGNQNAMHIYGTSDSFGTFAYQQICQDYLSTYREKHNTIKRIPVLTDISSPATLTTLLAPGGMTKRNK